jgi:hypothetical protein
VTVPEKRKLAKKGSKPADEDDYLPAKDSNGLKAPSKQKKQSSSFVIEKQSSSFVIEIPSSPVGPSPPKRSKSSSQDLISNEEAQLIAERFGGPATQVVRPKGSLCPFCDREISRQTPNSILRLMEELASKYRPKDKKKRVGSLANPNHVEVPLLERAALCNMHTQWTNEIPKGLEKGWPSAGSIDFQRLAKCVRGSLMRSQAYFSTKALVQLSSYGPPEGCCCRQAYVSLL